MTKEGKLCHDSAYPLSRIDRNIWLLLDKQKKEGLTQEELIKRLKIIEDQNNALRNYIDSFYNLCKDLRNNKTK